MMGYKNEKRFTRVNIVKRSYIIINACYAVNYQSMMSNPVYGTNAFGMRMPSEV
ncbi:hypothetical protein BSYN_16640 [Bacteroides sedimenti]|uniref:Uncharacterized protein n=1 Tax=Bacteroides sedimenti TaxID=2136147 RepID=A0ABN6ZB94_9BACE